MTTDQFIKAIPLGGLGQVGGNLMVYETSQDMLLVDCGILFPTSQQPGVNFLVPKIDYILQNIEKLRAVLITHGHEDHIGALPLLAQHLPVPIYATKFTLALIKAKFHFHDLPLPELREMFDAESFSVGGLNIEPIPVTHSIPDAVALSITAPVGTVIHTGDFKIDPHPIDGRLTGENRFREFNLLECGVTRTILFI